MKTRLAKNSDYNKINKLLVNLHNYHARYESFYLKNDPEHCIM
jgi:hypothetical protein